MAVAIFVTVTVTVRASPATHCGAATDTQEGPPTLYMRFAVFLLLLARNPAHGFLVAPPRALCSQLSAQPTSRMRMASTAEPAADPEETAEPAKPAKPMAVPSVPSASSTVCRCSDQGHGHIPCNASAHTPDRSVSPRVAHWVRRISMARWMQFMQLRTRHGRHRGSVVRPRARILTSAARAQRMTFSGA